MTAPDYFVLGIDCAVADNKVGIAFGSVSNGQLLIQHAGLLSRLSPSPEELLKAVLERGERCLVALDAPLGWPQVMGTNLAGHQAGEPLSGEASEMFQRHTDRTIRSRYGKRPLDVGADRIARTAFRAVNYLSSLRTKVDHPIPLAWRVEDFTSLAAIEVYPAATKRAYAALRGTALSAKQFTASVELEAYQVQLAPQVAGVEGHVLDAALCAVTARDFAEKRCLQLDPVEYAIAKKEGWIWVHAIPACSETNSGDAISEPKNIR